MTKPAKGTVIKPEGIKQALLQKTRSGRKTQEAVFELRQHTSGRNDLAPRLTLEYLPPASLKDARRRVRKADAAQVARIEKSIRELGCSKPVLVGDDLVIVDGHSIRDASINLQIPAIPVIRVDHLSPAEQRALAIALNRTAETGSWDVEALTLEISELIELDQDVMCLGFEHAEIDALLIEDETPNTEMDVVPDLPSHPTSRLGDVWLCGDHILAVGDARDPRIYTHLFEAGQCARLIATDPPFNVPVAGHCTTQAHHREFGFASGEMSRDEYLAFTKDWMVASLNHLIDGGLLASYIDWRTVDVVLETGRGLNLDLINMIVWGKTEAGMGSLWRSRHELLPVFCKGDGPHINNIELGKWGRQRSNLWLYPGASTTGSEARRLLDRHPTPKPCRLASDLLRDVTNRGDIVLDCFMGAGTTMIAAESTGRLCRGIELDAIYADVIVERWQQATGGKACLLETGEGYTDVVARRQAEGACT